MLGFRRQAILGVALPPRGCGGGVSPHKARPCIREPSYIFYELLNRGGCVILVVNIGKTR